MDMNNHLETMCAMLKNIFLSMIAVSVLGACATTTEKRATAKTKITDAQVMSDFDLCYGFFTIKDISDWYTYENTRRIRRLDCEAFREQVQEQYKGKEINYEALNVTKLFKKRENQKRNRILQDKTLNEVCYVKIRELVFAKRGQASACEKQSG